MALDYDHFTSGELNPIDNHIIVTDIDDEGEKIVNGIIIPSELGKDRGIKARWARVHAIGPNQDDVKVGEWVLVEHGRWTRGIKLNDGNVYRKVDPESILGASDDKPIT